MSGGVWTLASRLALWFALASALVLGATGAYLYRALERQLVEREDEQLVAKMEQLRHQLEEMPGGLEPAAVLHNVYGQAGLFLEVREVDGTILIASSPEQRLPAPSPALAAAQSPDGAWVHEWGHGGRVIAGWAFLRGSQPERKVMLVIAREGSQRLAVLASYKHDLLKGVIGGALAIALLGYAVARRALRPVRTIAHRAGGITANRLGERLSLSDVPAELAELVGAFNAMLERLDESFRRLAQFSSDLAHDLRTPIANLMTGTQVALSGQRAVEEYEALLGSQLEEYERINRMIEGMLFLARADNAQMALQPRTLDARSELGRVAEYFAGPAEEAQIGIQVAVEGAGDLRADPVLFRRAVSNLVTNALRFTPRGGTIGLRSYDRGDARCVVEVTNSGLPIAAEHLPRIFERFYRADRARSASQSSFGLGLAIVKSIVTLHGGTVEAESRPGQGTVFRLEFPGSPVHVAGMRRSFVDLDQRPRQRRCNP